MYKIHVFPTCIHFGEFFFYILKYVFLSRYNTSLYAQLVLQWNGLCSSVAPPEAIYIILCSICKLFVFIWDRLNILGVNFLHINGMPKAYSTHTSQTKPQSCAQYAKPSRDLHSCKCNFVYFVLFIKSTIKQPFILLSQVPHKNTHR